MIRRTAVIVAALTALAGCSSEGEKVDPALDALAMRAAWDTQSSAEKAETCAMYRSDPARYVELLSTVAVPGSNPATIRTFYNVTC